MGIPSMPCLTKHPSDVKTGASIRQSRSPLHDRIMLSLLMAALCKGIPVFTRHCGTLRTCGARPRAEKKQTPDARSRSPHKPTSFWICHCGSYLLDECRLGGYGPMLTSRPARGPIFLHLSFRSCAEVQSTQRISLQQHTQHNGAYTTR